MSDFIDRARALDKAATEGPWEARTHDLTDDVEVVHDGEYLSWVAMTGDASEQRSAEDAEFIAAARSMLPAAVEALARVRELHEPTGTRHLFSGSITTCATCYFEWPCPTVKAVQSALCLYTSRGTTYADTETTAYACATCEHEWTETHQHDGS